MKLISMTDFVTNYTETGCAVSQIKKMSNYAEFLKQPLKLEMFVPCDEKGNLLEEIIFSEQVHIYLNYQEKQDYVKRCDVYKKAKEKVLFEDFEIDTNKKGEKVILGDYTCLKVSDLENGTIEDLVKYVHIKLTKSAVQRIFG